MHILVVDSDTGLQEYYRNLLESEFRNVRLAFRTTGKDALDYLPAHEVDIVITESHVGNMELFDFLEQLSSRNLPAVVVTSQSGERLVVEAMRAGALDFVNKQNIKLGLLPDVIARALLEADRWIDIQKFQVTLPHRPEYMKLNQHVRAYIHAEQQEKMRALKMGQEGEGEQIFIDGQSYHIIYLYLQLLVPEVLRTGMEERAFLNIQNRLLDRLIDQVPVQGGSLWTRKEDAAFFAFKGDTYLSALLAALKIRAQAQIFNMTMENIREPIDVRMGMAASQTIFKEDKSQIYSEGLNLAAHLALYFPDPNALVLTSEIHERLSNRSRKYFFKVPEKFEGHTIYSYDFVA